MLKSWLQYSGQILHHCSGFLLVHMTLTLMLNVDWPKITTTSADESVQTVLDSFLYPMYLNFLNPFN